jgi:hypothetical protein
MTPSAGRLSRSRLEAKLHPSSTIPLFKHWACGSRLAVLRRQRDNPRNPLDLLWRRASSSLRHSPASRYLPRNSLGFGHHRCAGPMENSLPPGHCEEAKGRRSNRLGDAVAEHGVINPSRRSAKALWHRGDLDCFPFGYVSEPALSLPKGPALSLRAEAPQIEGLSKGSQ